LFKQCFVESKTAWQRGISAQNTSGSADFCIKSDSNALAEFLKPRIGSEQVIKLYINFKSFNLIFPLPKVH
jgi:predicted amidohydrolase